MLHAYVFLKCLPKEYFVWLKLVEIIEVELCVFFLCVWFLPGSALP